MPKTRQHTYLFGRLNLLGREGSFRQLLHNSLSHRATQTAGKFKYGFFDSYDISPQNEIFAFGRLVKYKSVLEGELVDEESHEVIEGGLPQGVVAKSEFFLHYNSKVVAYHPVVNRLSANQFRTMFAQLIEAANENFFIQVQVQTIDEEYKIQEDIKRFEIINRVSFDIHPTNPSANPFYKEVDERLKRLKAESFQGTLKSKEGGLNEEALLEDDIYRSIVMAVDGYGRGAVEGIMEGRKVTITTEDSPIKKEVLYSENPNEIILQLFPVFEQIWKRITK